MRLSVLILFLCCAAVLSAQTPLLTFEGEAPTLNDFNGGATVLIDNPDVSDPNTSMTVAQHTVAVGSQFGGVNIPFAVDFADGKAFTLDVWSPVADLPVLLKFEGGTNVERLATFSGPANGWQRLTFNFIEEPNLVFSSVSVFLNFNVIPQEEITYHFDNLEQIFIAPPAGSQMELPVTFDDETVNYGLIGFEGAVGNVVPEPGDEVNMVGRITKGPGSGTSSGATVTSLPGGPAGFASVIPFTADETTMSVRVWSPEAGIPVRLKVEKADDPTVSVEAQVMLDVAERWDTLVFDFTQEATGTAALNLNSVYNKASLFFRFGSVPAEVANYYFDNLSFGPVPQGEIPSSTATPVTGVLRAYPNPAGDRCLITAPVRMQRLTLYAADGRLVRRVSLNNSRHELNLAGLAPGLYTVITETTDGPFVIRILHN